MFKVAVGHSEDPDSLDAIKEILNQCREVLKENKPQAGVLFASPDYDHGAVLKHITEQFPGIEIVGCTSCGELSSLLGYMEGSMLLALFSSDRVDIRAGVIHDLSQENMKDVESGLKKVISLSDQDPRLIMTFPAYTPTSITKAVKGMEAVLGKHIPIVGASAADLQLQFTRNSAFYNTEVLKDSAPFLVFSGPLRYAIASSSGWQPFSPVKVIFDHKSNVISKIGDFRALDFFKHYLGSPPTLAYPLAIFQDKENEDAFFLRAALEADEEKGTVTMGADIPEIEMSCSIAKAEPEQLIIIMKDLISRTTDQGKPFDFTFIASCVCRQVILGTKIRNESDFIREAFSQENPSFGLYAYGQIGPLETDSPNLAHMETVVVVAMGEDDG